MAAPPLDLLRHFPKIPAEAWLEKMLHDIGKPDRLLWSAPEGFQVEPFYRREELPHMMPPRTQGNSWHIRQDVEAGVPENANQEAQEALRYGATAIGFVNAPSSQHAIHRLLDDIPLDTTPLHWERAHAPQHVLAVLRELCVNTRFSSLQGSLALDAFEKPDTGASYDALASLCQAAEGSQLRTVCIDMSVSHMAGATCVQELACALGMATEAFVQLTDRGIPAYLVAQRMYFVVPIGASYHMEIAKLRALRHLVRQLFAVFEVGDENPVVDARTSLRSYTWLDPETNLLRATTQAMAATTGGCASLLLLPHDESPDARRLACNVQLILKHEAYLDKVGDPAAGSFYIEKLTDILGRRSWSLFQQMEAEGGLLSRGMQQELEKAHAARRADLASGKRIMVGVNAFPSPDRHMRASTWQHKGDAEAFEAVRLRTEQLCQKREKRLSVQILDRSASPPLVALARRIFLCAGFAITEDMPDVVAICATEVDTLQILQTTAILVVVGPPNLQSQAIEITDFFVCEGQDTLTFISRIQNQCDPTFKK